MRPIYRKNSVLRRSQAMWGNKRVWRPRLVFWAGALAIGVISVAFAKLADMAQHLFHIMTGTHGWTTFLPLIITPLGFGFCAFMAIRFFPNAQGSGIPQAIAARHLTDDADRARLHSLNMVAGKILLTIVGLFCDASIGREGPTVQVGASLMLQAARWGGMVGSTGQRNMIDFMKHPEAHDGENRSSRFNATTEERALATLERWPVSQ